MAERSYAVIDATRAGWWFVLRDEDLVILTSTTGRGARMASGARIADGDEG